SSRRFGSTPTLATTGPARRPIRSIRRKRTSFSCGAISWDHAGSAGEGGETRPAMRNKIQRRLEEVVSLLPCPVSGGWGLHGAETSYFYDPNGGCHVLEVWHVAVGGDVDEAANGHEGTEPALLYGLAEFEFTELIKAVPLEHFHFSQRRAVFEI